MVKHIVMFKLSGTPQERLTVASRFKDALLALPGKIDVLRSMEVGINQN
ncbi:MAG: Dabb family protein, partial [Muribaculaceae bacterium]|nr:Dabb family protein [Muribaculaceae bacterium]